MAYSNILPAPGSRINGAGALDSNGLPAPGFSGLNMKLNQSSDVQRTRSNRGLVIAGTDFFWSFDIKYHEMTIPEYEAIENFLLSSNSKVKPFFVTLPNYNAPKPTIFNTFQISNPISVTAGTYYAGDTQILLSSGDTTLLPGCFINFVDSSDALHKSVYKVSRVETASSYSGIAVAANRIRITIFPPLQRGFVGATTVKFTNPQFRVIQKSDISPEFDQNNIVSFGLSVEEILP